MLKYLKLAFILSLKPYFLFQQVNTSYYKNLSSNIGVSAVSVKTLSAKTYSFNFPVYKIITDLGTDQLIVSVRQKDVTGKLYTNRGYHLIIKGNDSIVGIHEDSKLDINLSGEFLLMSNDKRTSRLNRTLAYEQFEYPSKIIFTTKKNNIGLTYNNSIRTGNETALSAVNLNDGKMIWKAPVTARSNWNSIAEIDNEILLIAAEGLHALNADSGLIWTYPLITSQKTNKPLTFSSFNRNTLSKLLSTYNTTNEEGLVTQIASNILYADGKIYFASKNKIVCLNNTGVANWEVDISNKQMSNCLLYDYGDKILMINLGIAFYNDNVILFGKPFVAVYNKINGELLKEKDIDPFTNIVDIIQVKRNKFLANRNKILQVSDSLEVETLIELNEFKYGKFLEFIDGNDFFVEKEGFYVPLNFINDNVVYFKTDHGKVFGLNGNEIEYEYHYTELYQINVSVGNNKLLSQKNKSILINENFELLSTFNCGETAVYLNNRLYFSDGRLFHIIHENELK